MPIRCRSPMLGSIASPLSTPVPRAPNTYCLPVRHLPRARPALVALVSGSTTSTNSPIQTPQAPAAARPHCHQMDELLALLAAPLAARFNGNSRGQIPDPCQSRLRGSAEPFDPWGSAEPPAPCGSAEPPMCVNPNSRLSAPCGITPRDCPTPELPFPHEPKMGGMACSSA